MPGPWEQYAAQPQQDEGAKPWEHFAAAAAPPPPKSMLQRSDDAVSGFVSKLARDYTTGGLSTLGKIGSTLLYPVDAAMDAINGDRGPTIESTISGKQPLTRNQERRQSFQEFVDGTGADKESLAYGAGGLATNIAATGGMGGLIKKAGFAAAPTLLANSPRAAQLLEAVATGGMRTGAPAAANFAGRAADMGIRAAGGAITGGASTALVDPEHAGTGAIIGGALPPAMAAVGKVGRVIGQSIAGSALGDEVRALALRAKDLGIDVPADRIVNSKPLNAVAAGLNYVPFSGRAATEAKMQSQLNQALSRTFGQDSSNVTASLRKAQEHLGGEFDRVLKSSKVKVDSQFLNELADQEAIALRELSPENARILSNQVDEIMSKGASGEIEGQAAYNIKKSLDRISKRNSNEAHYATDMRRSLMGALDRSLGPADAAAFATTRKQYGNMLSLEKLAQNGVDGDVSIARIANMKNIGNSDLQELADISAQFLKPREGQHGAAQRAFAGLGIGAMGGPSGLAAGAAVGRAANMALNSQALKNSILRIPPPTPPESMFLDQMYRATPVIPSLFD